MFCCPGAAVDFLFRTVPHPMSVTAKREAEHRTARTGSGAGASWWLVWPLHVVAATNRAMLRQVGIRSVPALSPRDELSTQKYVALAPTLDKTQSDSSIRRNLRCSNSLSPELQSPSPRKLRAEPSRKGRAPMKSFAPTNVIEGRSCVRE